jgi:hypothetical protein
MLQGLYRHDGWNIGLITGDVSLLLSSSTPHIDWLPIDGRKGFAADPFLIRENGALFCFFEALPYATDRGKICYVRIDEASRATLCVHDAIVEPYHLSYPFLLRHDGEIVCIPEASASGRLTAYVADAFPDGWHSKCVLIEDFPAVDPTIFHYAGRWWLLATDGRAGWNSDLHVWYADELFGTWRAHAGNPVKRDLAGSRPAGAPFTRDGRLFRPAQDCTLHYGRRLIINEILELTPESFTEKTVSIIEPDARGAFADGLHTANACDGLIAVDGNHFHFVPEQALRALRRRLLRLNNQA